MSSDEALRIIIAAQFFSGIEGGVEQAVIGLIHGLGRLADGSEEYLVVGPYHGSSWLAPYLGRNQRLVEGRPPEESPYEKFKATCKRSLGLAEKPVVAVWRGVKRLVTGPLKKFVAPLQISDGLYESLGANILHITDPLRFVQSHLPLVFTLHDLQHFYYPRFFSEEVLAWRAMAYPTACRQAQAICTASQFAKDDIARRYDISPDKIYVIPQAPPTAAYTAPDANDLQRVQRIYRLPKHFALFPALTYRHKNHIRLLEAVALLRDRRGDLVHVVCTGQKQLFWPEIRKRLYALRLQHQVRFLGFVPPSDLRALYKLARFMVFPSLFEGGALPLLEGFHEGLPITCSAIPALQEYAGDAAFFFDPTVVEGIAEAIHRMDSDAPLRQALQERGLRHVQQFRWDRSARIMRAVYRRVGNRALSAQDREALDAALRGIS